MTSFHSQQHHHPVPFSFDIPAQPQERPHKRYRDDEDDDEDDIHPSSSYASYPPDAAGDHHGHPDVSSQLGDEDDMGGEDLPAGDSLDQDASSLISQALNPDGTPKRPMNAFMIYARRRRPEVSVLHPAMRTGDISKILSKEWQAMGKVEKQKYLDMAKTLKDAFNTRWPDYVYKRRPNNTRKKRKNSNASSTRPDEGSPYLAHDEDVKPIIPSNAPPRQRASDGYAYEYAEHHHHSGVGPNRHSPHRGAHQHHPYMDRPGSPGRRQHRMSVSSQHHPHPHPHHHHHHHHHDHPHDPGYRTPPTTYNPYDSEYNTTPNLPSSAQHQSNPYQLNPAYPNPNPSPQMSNGGTPQQAFPPQFAHDLRGSGSRESLRGSGHRDSVGSAHGAMWAQQQQQQQQYSAAPHAGRTSRSSSSVSPVTVGGGVEMHHQHQHQHHGGLYRNVEGSGGSLDSWAGTEGLGVRTTRNDSIASSSTRPGTAPLDGGAGWTPVPEDGRMSVGGRPHSNSVSSMGRPNTGQGVITRPHSSSFSAGRGEPSPYMEQQQQQQMVAPRHHVQQQQQQPAPQEWSDGGPLDTTPDLNSTHPSVGSTPQQGYGFPMLSSPFYPSTAAPSGTPTLSVEVTGVSVAVGDMPLTTSPTTNFGPTAVVSPYQQQQNHGQHDQPQPQHYPQPSYEHRYSTSSAPEVLGGIPPSAPLQGDSYSVGTTTASLPTAASSPPVSTPPTPAYGTTTTGGSPHHAGQAYALPRGYSMDSHTVVHHAVNHQNLEGYTVGVPPATQQQHQYSHTTLTAADSNIVVGVGMVHHHHQHQQNVAPVYWDNTVKPEPTM